jgi:hypothetical protein
MIDFVEWDAIALRWLARAQGDLASRRNGPALGRQGKPGQARRLVVLAVVTEVVAGEQR